MEDGQAPSRAIWTLIGVDFFARVSYGLARTPVLPLYAAYLGAGPAMIGLVGAAATLTGLCLKLPAGAISDVVGRRPILMLGLVAFATGPLLVMLAKSPLALFGVRLYHGLATALYAPVAMAAVATLAESRRGECLSWLSNTKILGKLGGAYFGGLILSSAVAAAGATSYAASDFERVYLICAGAGSFALVLGAWRLSDLGDTSPAERRSWGEIRRKFRAGLREVTSDSRVLLASGCEGVQNLSVGVLEHFLPVYAVLVVGRTPYEAGTLYASQAVTTILAKPLLGRWSDRHGRRGVIHLGMWLCAAPLAAIPWTMGLGGLLALCLCFGLGEALVTSSSSALVADLCRRRSLGAAMGVFGTIKDAGHALGPILGGLLLLAFASGSSSEAATPATPGAYRLAFALVAALMAAYAVVFALSGRAAERRDGEGG